MKIKNLMFFAVLAAIVFVASIIVIDNEAQAQEKTRESSGNYYFSANEAEMQKAIEAFNKSFETSLYEAVITVDSAQNIRSGFDLDDDENIIIPASIPGYCNVFKIDLGECTREEAEKKFWLFYTESESSFMSLPGGEDYTWICIRSNEIETMEGNSTLKQWINDNANDSTKYLWIALTDSVNIDIVEK